MDNTLKKNRVVYLDMIRIVATVAVVAIHVVSISWHKVKVDTPSWDLLNIIDSLCRWCVPCFVMISGSLFLNPDKKLDVKKLYSKNILRMITALVFWCAVYFVVEKYIMGTQFTTLSSYKNFISGYKHMWYLFMAAGLYILTPLLRKVTEDKALTKYFLIVTFVFGIMAYNLFDVVKPLLAKGAVYTVIGYFESAYGKFHFGYLAEYTFYYVAGYVLSKTDFSKKSKTLFILLGILGTALIIGLTKLVSLHYGKGMTQLYEYCSLTVLMQAFGVFMLFKSIKWPQGDLFLKVLSHLSKISFGIYLVHRVFIFTLQTKWTTYEKSDNPVLTLICYFFITIIGSYIVSAILNKIPRLNKYIV